MGTTPHHLVRGGIPLVPYSAPASTTRGACPMSRGVDVKCSNSMADVCRACGNALTFGARVCPNCGTAVGAGVPTVPSMNRPSVQPMGPAPEPTVRAPDLDRTTAYPFTTTPPASSTPPPPPAAMMPTLSKSRRSGSTAIPPSHSASQRSGATIALVAVIVTSIVLGLATLIAIRVRNPANHHRATVGAISLGGSDEETSTSTAQTNAVGDTATAEQSDAASSPVVAGRYVLADGTIDTDGTVALIQRYNSAMANHDWALARSLRPELNKSTDADLEDGFGGLKKATVVATSVSSDGSFVRGGLVGWEIVKGAKRTSLYCKDWTVEGGIVTAENDLDPSDGGDTWPLEGWEYLNDIASFVSSYCD